MSPSTQNKWAEAILFKKLNRFMLNYKIRLGSLKRLQMKKE